MIREGNLWGDYIQLNAEDIIKKVLDKIENPQEVDFKKVLKSSKLTEEEKLVIIEDRVKRVLGKHIGDTLVIRDRDTLHKYIDKAIENGIIAVDTETNHSLDPITCKLIGPCLYTWDTKQAYIPVNHIDLHTGERLANQLSEKDIKEELYRLVWHNVKIVYHNAKFDYQVLKCTCDLKLTIYWDTLIGAKILNENEEAGLKPQYISKIDKTQERYSIESLFEDIRYEIVDPNIFALYAAADSFMTLKLYEWQVKEFAKKGNERIYNVFWNIEMPVIEPTAEMELNGICIDPPFAKRLNKKYNKILGEIKEELDNEFEKYRPQFEEWKASPEANERETKKNKKGQLVQGKSKLEQLTDPINFSSPTQLAIFLYDVLKLTSPDKDKPRGTGEEILEELDNSFCDVLIKYKKTEKIVTAFTEKLPNEVKAKTGRVHCKFNQYGAKTGRYSCSEPNLQQVPSHLKDVRMMFIASTSYEDKEVGDDNQVTVDPWDEVELENEEWLHAKDLQVGQKLFNNYLIKHITQKDNKLLLSVEKF